MDVDNCPEHRIIREIRIFPVNPVTGEDILLASGEIIAFEPYTESDSGSTSGSTSGSGSGGNDSEEIVYVERFSCNETVTVGCYDDYLRGLTYNNMAEEPSLLPRHIILEVCRAEEESHSPS